jgi:hypothetical protein
MLQTLHGSILLSAAVLAVLAGASSSYRARSPLASSTGLPLFMLLVHSGISTVREKPLPATCFDSFAQLCSGLIVNAPDLSSTCIEFEGTLAGRPVRVLLDSGASANFVNSDLVCNGRKLPGPEMCRILGRKLPGPEMKVLESGTRLGDEGSPGTDRLVTDSAEYSNLTGVSSLSLFLCHHKVVSASKARFC